MNQPLRHSKGVTLASPHAIASDPIGIVLKRIRQGLYGLCVLGVGGVVSGSFIFALTPMAILAAFSTALLLGACGLVVELMENSRRREGEDADS